MPAFLIVSFDVVDRAALDDYGTKVAPLVAKHHGTVLASDRAAHRLEGTPGAVSVIVSFPSHDEAMAFYDDPEYQPIKAIRLDATRNTSATVAAGVARPA